MKSSFPASSYLSLLLNSMKLSLLCDKLLMNGLKKSKISKVLNDLNIILNKLYKNYYQNDISNDNETGLLF